MNNATYLATVSAALAIGFAVPDTHAQHKPADVADPTLGQATPAGTAALYVHSHRLTARNGAVRIAVECPALALHCHGTLELRSLGHTRLGTATVDLAGGERRRVRVPVTARTASAYGRVVFAAGTPLATKLVALEGTRSR